MPCLFFTPLHSRIHSDGGPGPEGVSLREVNVGGGGSVVVAGGEADQDSDLVFVLGSLVLKFLQLLSFYSTFFRV